MIYVVIGVCGCGKTTLGETLAATLNIPFFDADEMHPQENITKMSHGLLLEDSDRLPWLQSLHDKVVLPHLRTGAVLACAALKEDHRKIISGANANDVIFIFLKGDRETISQRLQKRKGFRIPPKLLDSQLAALEEPSDALTIDATKHPEEICEEILKIISH